MCAHVYRRSKKCEWTASQVGDNEFGRERIASLFAPWKWLKTKFQIAILSTPDRSLDYHVHKMLTHKFKKHEVCLYKINVVDKNNFDWLCPFWLFVILFGGFFFTQYSLSAKNENENRLDALARKFLSPLHSDNHLTR